MIQHRELVIMTKEKQCPHCEKYKSLDCFSPNASWCKVCINERERLKRESERAMLGLERYERKSKPEPAPLKKCSICLEEKTHDQFSPGSGKCKPCKNEQERQYRKTESYTPPVRSPEYAAWCEMRKRCLSESHPAYPHYGGRGIMIDSDWLQSFSNFSRDMGPRPSSEHSLERKNNDLGYNSNNCEWATRTKQCRNRRSNRLVDINGSVMTVAELSEMTGISHATLTSRLNSGKAGDDLIRPISRSK